MLAFLVLETDVNIYDALKIKEQLKLEKIDNNTAYTERYQGEGIRRIGVRIDLAKALDKTNDNNCQIDIAVNTFKFCDNAGIPDIREIEHHIGELFSNNGFANLGWRILYFSFVTTIKTEYVSEYIELIKRKGALSGKGEAFDVDKDRICFENGSRKLIIDGTKYKDRLRLTMSIKNRKINEIKKSDDFEFENKNISSVTNEMIFELESKLWNYYMTRIIGDADYYSLNEAERVLKVNCKKIAVRHKMVAILKGISVYKGINSYLNHVEDESARDKYDYMEEVTSQSTAKKYIKDLEKEYHINPIIISRRDAAELKINMLPSLISLLDCTVYDSKQTVIEVDDMIYPPFH